MTKRVLLRLWLFAMDRCRMGSPLYLWIVGKASGCIEYDDFVPDSGREPF